MKKAAIDGAVKPDTVVTPAIQTVYFVDVVLVTPQNPRQIDVVRADSIGDPPEAMQVLLQQIGLIGRVIARVFNQAAVQRKTLFEHLHQAADLGLRGEKYSVLAATSDLLEVKAHIVDAFSTVRGDIWRRNLWFVGSASVAAIPGAVLFYAAQNNLWGVPPVQAGTFHPAVAAVIALFWIPLGVAMGVFLEFSYSVDREIPFEDLLGLNPGRWKPGQRFLNAIVTAYCFAAIMGFGAFQIGVLSLLLNDFATTKPLLSVAVGFVTGFAFPYVRDLIFKFKPVQKT